LQNPQEHLFIVGKNIISKIGFFEAWLQYNTYELGVPTERRSHPKGDYETISQKRSCFLELFIFQSWVSW